MDSRKEAILEALVREYTQTGIPVGSLMLTRQYSLPFSPATVRAEMAELERLGYLSHPHTSAGRIPTEKGYRYYVDLLKGEQLLERQGALAHKKIQAAGGGLERRLDTASQILSDLTHHMGFAGTLDDLYSHGLGNLFSYPELLEPGRAPKAAEMIDNLSVLLRELPDECETRVYIGSEVPVGKSAGCSIVVSRFESPEGRYGYLGIIGPTRMAYERGISAINEIKNMLEEPHE